MTSVFERVWSKVRIGQKGDHHDYLSQIILCHFLGSSNTDLSSCIVLASNAFLFAFRFIEISG